MWDELTMKLRQNTSLKGHLVMTHCERVFSYCLPLNCAMSLINFSLYISSILMTQSRNCTIIKFHLNSVGKFCQFTNRCYRVRRQQSRAHDHLVYQLFNLNLIHLQAQKNILAVYYNCRSFNVAITEHIVKWNVKSDQFNGLLIM